MAKLLHYAGPKDEYVVLLEATNEDEFDDPEYTKTVYDIGDGTWPVGLPTDRPLTQE
ncbi:hypothetical protein LCGC14_1099230 [marine sediment metagenome]|uniref:Uncharacterized protein n=1 Tax=marine sediment metagenome TaxID=412755 RepID=A0A0F9MA54_9ZZZZ